MIKDEKKGLKEREDLEVLKNLIKLNGQERELIDWIALCNSCHSKYDKIEKEINKGASNK